MVKLATPADAGALATLINDAFIVEAFFKIGDRTSVEEIARLMNEGGEFLVLDDEVDHQPFAGCVYKKQTFFHNQPGPLPVAIVFLK